MCPHGYHHNGFMANPALGTQEVRLISILLYTRNPYSYSHFEIVICFYSVRGDIDQKSTKTSSYTICRAPNFYIFVYVLIETRIAPLNVDVVAL